MGIFGGEPKAEATPEEFTKITGVEPGQPATGVAVTPDAVEAFRTAQEGQDITPPTAVSESQTAGLAVTAEETARREAAGQSTESTPAVPEQTEQERIARIFNQVKDVNGQLGGYVGVECPSKDGTAIIFTHGSRDEESPLGTRHIYYGVDDVRGPVALILVNSDKKLQSLEAAIQGRNDPNRTAELEDMIWQCHPLDTRGGINNWETAFNASKNTVMGNETLMKSLKVERNTMLDKALDAVSQPIDINATPPAAGPTV